MRTAERLSGWLRYLGLPILLLTVAAGLTWVERGWLVSYGHLRPATEPGALPELRAEMLDALASVLLEVYPDRAESSRYAGVSSAERGELERARRHFARAVEIDPRDGRLLFWYGQVLILLDEDPAELRRIGRILARHFPAQFDALEAFEISRLQRAGSAK
ncbi:MAG: hypothetical protein VX614_00415 [Myxococcota bacterium]|nr:hypothetical protein [Myxococcota bacterium]